MKSTMSFFSIVIGGIWCFRHQLSLMPTSGLWLGFKNDVVIRVRAADGGAAFNKENETASLLGAIRSSRTSVRVRFEVLPKKNLAVIVAVRRSAL